MDLSNPVGTTTPDLSALVTIIDDEVGAFGSGSIKFYRSTYTAAERSGIAVVEVSRVGGTSGTVSTDYKTDGGTAVINADYEAVNGTITFGPGEARKSFTIPLIVDDINDSGERINLKLENPVGTVLTSPTSSAVIIE
ncbi:MAG: Calx-beta domain-containing protein [Candidatus Peribacteraceae bacterium]|nr:Calx-beta domain-containing protein [Candidatus Peribacteraceae bacterium]